VVKATYPKAQVRRLALAPAILGALAALLGVLLIDTEPYIVVRFVVSILALIVAVFAWQGRAWWWLLPLGAIAVVWNPVYVIPVAGVLWLGLHYIAALVFIVVGIFVKVRIDE
jgi:hypothetical protein